jgi:predicted PurR-regulated permease PerM
VKIKSLHIKNKIEICGITVITSLFAAALISNLGFSSTDVFAQGSQNATQQQQQQQDTTLAPVLNFTQNLRTLAQELGVSTTSSLEEIRNAVQQFTNNTNFEQFSQRLSQFAQQSGLNTTRLEQASPDGNITGRLQNFTESIERDITR